MFQLASTLILFFVGNFELHSINLIGKYASQDGICTLEIKGRTANELQGTHCFVSTDGKFIDCCLDETSFRLKETKNGIFTGNLSSCYSQGAYAIELRIIENNIEIYFVKGHPFLARKMVFSKVSKTKNSKVKNQK